MLGLSVRAVLALGVEPGYVLVMTRGSSERLRTGSTFMVTKNLGLRSAAVSILE